MFIAAYYTSPKCNTLVFVDDEEADICLAAPDEKPYDFPEANKQPLPQLLGTRFGYGTADTPDAKQQARLKRAQEKIERAQAMEAQRVALELQKKEAERLFNEWLAAQRMLAPRTKTWVPLPALSTWSGMSEEELYYRLMLDSVQYVLVEGTLHFDYLSVLKWQFKNGFYEENNGTA